LTWTAGNTETAYPLSFEIMPSATPASTGDVYVVLTNKCGSNNTDTVEVIVNDIPTMTDFTQPGPCIEYFDLAIPTVTWNGSVGTTDLQYYNTSTSAWVSTTEAALADLDNNGLLVRYIATNDCGYVADSLILAVIDTPQITLVVDPTLVCQGSEIELEYEANWTPSADQITYQMSTDQTTWTEVDNTLEMSNAGTFYFRISATNQCAPDGLVSNVVSVIVEPTPVLEQLETIVMCNNDDPAQYSITTNRNIYLTNAPTWITVNPDYPTVITITPNTDIAAGTYTFTVNTMTDACEPLSVVDTVIMNSVPVIETFEVNKNIYCIGDTLTINHEIEFNAVDEVSAILTAYRGETEVLDFDLPHIISILDTNLRLVLAASNPCGSVSSTVNVNVSAPVQFIDTFFNDCADQKIYVYYPVPEYTLYGATEVLDEGWIIYSTSDTIHIADTASTVAIVPEGSYYVAYYVTTQCGTYVSRVWTITAYGAPEIHENLTFEICDGDTLVEPPYLLPVRGPLYFYVETQSDIVTDSWTIDWEPMVWDIPYGVEHNGDTIRYIVETACGADTAMWVLTVNPLPVPEILSDTIICHDGSTTLTTDTGYVTYQWFQDGDTIVGATTNTYTVNAANLAAEDAFYTYTVTVTDTNGCVSNTNLNGSYQALDATAVTVQVTDAPRFVFKYGGVETHYINGIETIDPSDATSDVDLVYTWEVENPCYNEDTLVYVTFDIYHNDTLIDNNTIGNYLTNTNIPGSYTQFWNTSIDYTFLYGSATANNPQSSLTYYNTAQGGETSTYDNHFPYSRIFAGGSTFDDVYLHFLANNVYTQTVRPFRIPGEYKIIYTIYSTSNVDVYNYPYFNGDTSRIIGGYNSLVATAIKNLLAQDSIMITVTGEAVSALAEETPELAPTTPINAEQPTLKIYPNPTSSELNAEIEGLTGETTIQIVNLTGAVVSTDKVNIPATGKYIYRSTASNLAPGIYFMYIINDNATLSKKLVVKR